MSNYPETKLPRNSKSNCDTSAEDVKQPIATEPPDSTISDLHLTLIWQHRKPFAEGEDILVHDRDGGDGLIYFGIIVEVDHDAGQCLVRFGDCTERWSFFHELKRLGDPDSLEPPAQAPAISSQPITTTPRAPANNVKLEPAEEEEEAKPVVVPSHVEKARGQLSYKFDSLVWDSSHQRNQQEIYCYCGESGEWYKRMLQCKDCLQWFHQECIRSLDYQLLCGDRFFEFTCTLCNGSHEETITRLDLSLVDSLHLAIFNLILSKNQKFHDLDSATLPFIRKNIKYLQGMDHNFKASQIDAEYISKLLVRNKSRFKCGSETGKKNSFWGLRKMCAPPLPSKYFPRDWGRWAPPPSPTSVKPDPASKRLDPRMNNRIPGFPRSGRLHKRTPNSLHLKYKHHHRSRLKDSDNDSDTSSKVALEVLIKPPTDFTGFNNPFRIAAAALSGDGDGTSTPNSDSSGSRRGAELSMPNSCLRKMVCSEKSSPVSSGAPSTIITDDSFAEDSYHNSLENTEDESQSFKSPGIKLSDLKGTLSSYFAPCAKKRMERGDIFSVNAKRLTLNGDIAYLIQWENPVPSEQYDNL